MLSNNEILLYVCSHNTWNNHLSLYLINRIYTPLYDSVLLYNRLVPNTIVVSCNCLFLFGKALPSIPSVIIPVPDISRFSEDGFGSTISRFPPSSFIHYSSALILPLI